MKSIYCAFIAINLTLVSTAVNAEDAAVVAAKFGALPMIEGLSVSPDGNMIAFLTPHLDDGKTLVVVDLAKGARPAPVLTSTRDNGDLYNCGWASNTRLVCSAYYIASNTISLIGFNRLFAVNADGSKVVQVSARTNGDQLGLMQDGGRVVDWTVPNSPGSILMTRQFVPEMETGRLTAQRGEGLGVEAVDTLTLKRRTVEPPKASATHYVSDGKGNVRLMGIAGQSGTGLMTGNFKYMFRTKDSREWRPLSNGTSDNESGGFDPVAVDAKSDVAFGYVNDSEGFGQLVSVSLDGTGKREVLLAKPGIDVDSLLTFGRGNRIVGASYATDKRSFDFFDAELKSLRRALSKALPGSPDIAFLDASADESKVVVLATRDTNPGQTYLYDKANRKLAEILPLRPQLQGVPLAEMKPITFPAADGTMIPAYLTIPAESSGKGLPAIVMPHGGPSSRDEWGFDWLVQFFAARGFAVIQPNYRGSSGYGSNWYQHNGFKSWRRAIGDVNDSGRWMLAQGIAAPGKLAIVGWSYGGYAALQSQVLDPGLFKAAISIAPVTDLDKLREESRGFTNSALVDQFIGTGPHIAEGSPARHAELFKAPVLLFHGDLDQNVGVGESRLMRKRLAEAGKSVEYVEFKGLDHQLVSAAARTRLLADSDAFLRKALGLPAK